MAEEALDGARSDRFEFHLLGIEKIERQGEIVGVIGDGLRRTVGADHLQKKLLNRFREAGDDPVDIFRQAAGDDGGVEGGTCTHRYHSFCNFVISGNPAGSGRAFSPGLVLILFCRRRKHDEYLRKAGSEENAGMVAR